MSAARGNNKNEATIRHDLGLNEALPKGFYGQTNVGTLTLSKVNQIPSVKKKVLRF